MARQLARDAGAWTVVLGDFTRAGDSLHLVARVYDVATGNRVDVAQVDGAPGEDVRPLFDQLAAKLLNLSGAPTGTRAELWRATTSSVEAFRSYLQGIEHLNQWSLGEAEADLSRATKIDSTFALAYYKLALTRGWATGQGDSLGIEAIHRATQYSDRLPERDRTMIRAYRAFIDGDYATSRGNYQQLLSRDSTDADAWYGLGDVWFHDTTQERPGRAPTSHHVLPGLQEGDRARPRLLPRLRARPAVAEHGVAKGPANGAHARTIRSRCQKMTGATGCWTVRRSRRASTARGWRGSPARGAGSRVSRRILTRRMR